METQTFRSEKLDPDLVLGSIIRVVISAQLSHSQVVRVIQLVEREVSVRF